MALSMNLGADDKKKLYLLGGLLGVLGVVGTIFIIRPMLSGGTPDDETTNIAVTTSNVTTNSASPTTPPANGAQFGNSAAGAAPATGATGTAENAIFEPQLIGVGRNRSNPFAPEVVPIALPTPIPPPAAPRYRPVESFETLPPVRLAPYTPQLESTTVALPGSPISSSAASNSTGSGGLGVHGSRILMSLPPAAIFGNTARVAPRSLPEVGGLNFAAPGAQANIVSATDKRVAGVIIGDTIRALIEYQDNGRQVYRIVQPGDTVAGMEILSIRRLLEGEDTTTRVTVRENGEEKFFDLKTR